MKINMTATNTEYVPKETDAVVSMTNQMGVITYVNEDFLRGSRFTGPEIASFRG